MTTGQRIAARRKELNLSQESLGEALGVSRQSIYKWESDGSLPEIDKLISMSRLFGVSVGWLLGVEELQEKPGDDLLTEGQLKMVEEILRRYQLSAQAELKEAQREQIETLVTERLAQQPKKRRRWWLYAAAVLAIVICAVSLFDRLEQINQQYNNLANSVSNISSSVDRDINSIASRVEEVLKAQNHLTAEYGTELKTADLTVNTVTFTASAVPRTYVEGMTVHFLADTGDGNVVEVPGDLVRAREFSAEITCDLTDNITLSAVFTADGVSQTQLLDTYTYLYSGSLPLVSINERDLHWKDAEPNDPYTFHWENEYVDVGQDVYNHYRGGGDEVELAEVKTVQIGLFCNRELVTWLEPAEKPSNYHGFEGRQFYKLSGIDLTLKEGDLLQLAALITDEYGRTFLQPQELPPFTPRDGELEYATNVHVYEGIQDPADWGITVA